MTIGCKLKKGKLAPNSAVTTYDPQFSEFLTSFSLRFPLPIKQSNELICYRPGIKTIIRMILHNKLSRAEALTEIKKENYKRTTLSFYRYLIIEDPIAFRDRLFNDWSMLACFGRIYIANEGINAQMSIPNHNLGVFIALLRKYDSFENMPLKYAVEDDGLSFFKLTIKVRPKIVADGLDDNSYDVTNVGTHLSPLEFHQLTGDKDTLTIDMRNHYESEVGKFSDAYCPDAETFRDAIRQVEQKFEANKEKKILLYCTGGIRCEKASAFLKDKGFKDVNQLHGGIIAYANEIKKVGVASKFTGKNFVFDQRLGESIDGNVIAKCHQCGASCDTHVNCKNDACHLLFIQCTTCAQQFDECCSNDCKDILLLDPEKQKEHRKLRLDKYAGSKIFKRHRLNQLNENSKRK